MFIANTILLLVYRNLVAAIDRIFLVWQIAFPIVYTFVAGYAYSAILTEQAINHYLSVTYTSFLTAGMIGEKKQDVIHIMLQKVTKRTIIKLQQRVTLSIQKLYFKNCSTFVIYKEWLPLHYF
jgi:hypothetical protein